MTATTDFSRALHIITGDSAAGSLKCAFRLDLDRLLINRDPIHCGPAPATDDLTLWRDLHGSFLQTAYLEDPLSLDDDPHTELVANVKRLGADGQVIIWVARGLAEQILLAWVVCLFDQQGFDPSRIGVVQFTNLRPRQKIMGMGELSPESFRKISPPARRLIAEELDELRSVWKAYTSASPEALTSYLEGSTSLPLLQEAIRQLIGRYPDQQTGLSVCDTWLLEHTIEHGPLPARVVGYTMGDNATPDQVGDRHLFHRLCRLGRPESPSPLVSLSGDTRAMRTCRVEITDFGRRVLAGEANHVVANGIDDWIGGVHLKSGERVIYRDGDRLVPSP